MQKVVVLSAKRHANTKFLRPSRDRSSEDASNTQRGENERGRGEPTEQHGIEALRSGRSRIDLLHRPHLGDR